MSKLSASESVYGFAAWLTSRNEKVTLSSKCNAAPIAELVGQFCRENKLPDPRPHFNKRLSYPKG